MIKGCRLKGNIQFFHAGGTTTGNRDKIVKKQGIIMLKRFKETQKEYNKEGQQGANPYTLPPINLLISLLPAPQLDGKRTIWKGLKV